MGLKADTVRQLLHGLVEALNAEGVDYALCGGWAVGIWGYERVTTDIDMVLRNEDLIRVRRALEPVGFTLVAGLIPLPSQGIEFYRISAVADNEIVPLDIYPVPESHPYLKNKSIADWRGLRVPVLDIDDLIGMKSTSERPKDKLDIEELRRRRDEAGSGNA